MKRSFPGRNTLTQRSLSSASTLNLFPKQYVAVVLTVLTCTAGDHACLAEPTLPANFVYLRDLAPSILQDIRYAGPNNFTGHAVLGYNAAECVLDRKVAEALKQIQEDLLGQDLSIKVYDCYRPGRAVRAMINWAKTSGPQTDPRYHPRVKKAELVSRGYIATTSAHSSGYAVDLTISRRNPSGSSLALTPTARCTTAVSAGSENVIDMGTEFDCFDPRSQTDSAEVTATQRRWRRLLRDAMTRGGFHCLLS